MLRAGLILVSCALCLAAPAQILEGVQPIPHPTLTADLGWQYGRTLAECNQYMLDHQLATDIGFLVGPRGQARSLIRAHRYVLLSRSAVFTKLLMQNNAIDKDLLPASSSAYGNVTIPSGHPMSTIEIPDMDPAVFRQMLNFIYTDNATLDLRNVIPLMYAAKKYQLPNLMSECQRVLQQNISLDNVCIILNQAVYFNEEQLINKSLGLIGGNAEQVLSSEGYEQLSHAALKAVISYDGLDANETFVFERCIHWARRQIQAKNLTEGMDMIRITLDDIIYHIRFPVMEQKVFAELLGTSDLLNCTEKASIYYYIATQDHMNNSLGFDWKKRNRTRVLDRFESFSASNNWGCGHTMEKIQFTVTKAITLKGIGTYHVRRQNNQRYYQHYNQPSLNETLTFSVSVTRNDFKYGRGSSNEIRVGGTQKFTYTYNGQNREVVTKIPLDEEIRIQPNYYYSITLQLPTSEFCFVGYGTNSRGPRLQGDDLYFTFNGAGTQTNENQGQIPRLYYSM